MSIVQIDASDLTGTLELDIDLPSILESISTNDVTAAIKSTFSEDDLIDMIFIDKSETEQMNLMTKILAGFFGEDNSGVLKLLVGNHTKIDDCTEFAQHFVAMINESPTLKVAIKKEIVWQEHLAKKKLDENSVVSK